MVMAAETAPKKTLKIKFSTLPREHVTQSSFVRTWVSCVSEGEVSHSKSDKLPVLSDGNKRSRPSSAQFCSEKRQKMDRGISQQCSAVVKVLIRHPAGWVFKEPVDPEKLNIPDYFTVIKKPMDLGTIKSKLEKKQYAEADDFVADVRLTFSNAMLYNPPSNSVHQMAKELLEVFETQWRSWEGKTAPSLSKSGNGKLFTVVAEEINNEAQLHPETPLEKPIRLPKKPKPSTFKVKHVRTTQNCVDNLTADCHSDKDDVAQEQPKSIGAVSVCPNCSTSCHCNISCDSAPASSDLSYERPCCDALKDLKASNTTKSDQDSDGSVCALDDEASGQGWRSPPSEIQLSPTKALRAAMLKQRFADTILKAKHKALHDTSDVMDPAKMRIEKERLEKKQQEERARIKARIEEAEAATRKKEEMELRKQRERQREAARVALQKMEKTADIELNLEILRELEVLSGGTLIYSPRFKPGEGEADEYDSPLKQLGLFMKDEANEEQDVLNGDGEEGEILF